MGSTTQSRPDTFPLFEREASLERLRRALDDVRMGEGRVVFVHGEAGVGKTALVQRFCSELDGDTRVLLGACDPLFTPRPLGPLVDISVATGGALAAGVREGAIPYGIAALLLDELAAARPTVLVIEDLHWADEATLDVVRLLVRRIDQTQALVIATYRDDELDSKHPLRVVLGGLGSLRDVQRMGLQPLSRDAVGQLSESYGADPDELFRMTSGNPFFLTEVLAASPNAIPETVRDAVRARMAGLSDESISVLEAVSTLPAGAEPWLLETLVGSLDGGLEGCLRSGVLVHLEGKIAFRHELARLTVVESLPLDRLHSLNRRALRALESRPSSQQDLARLAHHAEAAGEVDAVLAYAPEAAARSSSLGAHREAAAQYRRALRSADHLPQDVRATLLTRYAHECYLTDELEAAIEALDEARACFQELGDRTAEGAILTRMSTILWCPGRSAEAHQVGREAVAFLEELPRGAELGAAYDNMAFLHRMNGDLGAARMWADRECSLADELADDGARQWASGSVALIEAAAGSHDAVAAFERRIELALASGHEVDAAYMIDGLTLAIAYSGPRQVERRLLEAGIVRARTSGLDLTHLYLLAFTSRLELDEGRWAEAAECAELTLGEHFVSTYPRLLALVTLALVRARRGDPDVWPLLDAARELSEPTGEIIRIGPVAAARGEAAWLSGRAGGVARETDAAFELALEKGAPRATAELASLRRRAGIEDAFPEHALEPWRSQLLGEWQTAATGWRSLACPYETALALYEGDDPEGLREALDICTELGATPLAAMIGRRLRELGISVPRGPRPSTRDNPAGLTSRESEILGLLAEGLRNTDIAERLVVSRRTIDHHVSSILRKLDARTRSEAVATGRQLGLVEDR